MMLLRSNAVSQGPSSTCLKCVVSRHNILPDENERDRAVPIFGTSLVWIFGFYGVHSMETLPLSLGDPDPRFLLLWSSICLLISVLQSDQTIDTNPFEMRAFVAILIGHSIQGPPPCSPFWSIRCSPKCNQRR